MAQILNQAAVSPDSSVIVNVAGAGNGGNVSEVFTLAQLGIIPGQRAAEPQFPHAEVEAIRNNAGLTAAQQAQQVKDVMSAFQTSVSGYQASGGMRLEDQVVAKVAETLRRNHRWTGNDNNLSCIAQQNPANGSWTFTVTREGYWG